MNKSVLEKLIDAAGFSTTYERERLERLAENVIRECINICTSRAGNADYNTGRMHCASDIREHFEMK